jgi:hypothetical protein
LVECDIGALSGPENAYAPPEDAVSRDAKRAVWNRVADHPLIARGFDSSTSWWPHASVPPLDGVHKPLGRPVELEDVRGSLAGIAELAGWWSRTMPTDPCSATTRECVHTIASEIEQVSAALQRALDDYETNTTTEGTQQ